MANPALKNPPNNAVALASTAPAWLKRFKEFGAAPSVPGYMSLFNADAVVVESGLTLSYSGNDVRASMEKLLSALPDLRIDIVRHRIRNNSIFIETKNSGTHEGKKLAWGACYVATLTGNLVSRFRIFVDHAEMLEPFLTGAPAFPGYSEAWDESVAGTAAVPHGRWDPTKFIDAYQAVWRNPSPMGFANFYSPGGTILNPGFKRPIVKAEIPGYYAWLMRRVPHIEMALADWAGDTDLVYAEWVASGVMDGAPFTIRVIDVFHFDDDGVIYGEAYYDTLKTIARLDPSVARHREPFFISSV